MMQGKKSFRMNTQLVHAGERGAVPLGKPVSTPIYATATFTYDSMAEVDQVFAGEKQGYIYILLWQPNYRGPSAGGSGARGRCCLLWSFNWHGRAPCCNLRL